MQKFFKSMSLRTFYIIAVIVPVVLAWMCWVLDTYLQVQLVKLFW